MKRVASIATALARAFLMVRHERSVLGVLWYALGPIMMLFVVVVLHHATDSFGKPALISIAVGLCCFSLFRSVTSNVSSAARNSIGLLRNVTVPVSAIFAARAIESVAIHCVEILLVIGIALYGGYAWYGIVMYLVSFALFLSIAISIGLLLAVVASYTDDIRNMWSYFVTVAMFTAPVFVEILPQNRPWFMNVNPITSYVDAARAAIQHGYIAWSSVGDLCVWSLSLGLVAWIVLRLFGPTLVERL